MFRQFYRGSANCLNLTQLLIQKYFQIIIINIKFQDRNIMNKQCCENCQMLFNIKRKPYLLQCGHTACQQCFFGKDFNNIPDQIRKKQKIKCFSCKQISRSTYNIALHQLILTQNKYKQIDKLCKVCFFGQVSVGKSSLVNRLVKNKFIDQMIPTIGLNFQFIDKAINSYKVRFQMWDSAGTERYRAIPSSHYKNADIALIVYDIEKSLQENGIQYWFNQLEEKCQTPNILIIANKIDLIGQHSQIRQQKTKNMKYVENKCNQKGWKHIIISCKTEQGIQSLWKLMFKLSIEISQKSKNIPRSIILSQTSISSLSEKLPQKRRTCCNST